MSDLDEILGQIKNPKKPTNKAAPSPEGENSAGEPEPVVDEETLEIEDEISAEFNNDKGSETRPEVDAGTINVEKDIEPETGKPVFKVFISGRLALTVLDELVPKVILWGGKMAKLNIVSKVEDMKMTKEEFEEMEPLTEEVVKELFMHLTKFQQFLIMLGFIYGPKVKMGAKEEKK